MKNYNRGQIREKDVKGNEKELHEAIVAVLMCNQLFGGIKQ